ncbi:MAG: GNAT family N-acetyltransferase [Candidatus Cloacimonetes bacterium]|nr:GNAT family N-acetyltransferase [Candidatus Cloacimonadota bacterium]
MQKKYFKKIIGDKCYLSPVSMEDAGQYTEWLNDMSVSITMGQFSQVISLEKEKEILQKISRDYIFAIIDKSTDKLIGNTGLHKIDWVNRTAEYGIFIGDKSFWNKGYATEVNILMLDYAFYVLNLKHVHLQVLAFNKWAIKSYEKAGYKTVGKLTEFWEIEGKRHDMLIMEALAKDIESRFFVTGIGKGILHQ